ncbi:MAG: 4Fe-4S dicluster domain-containing protein [Dehalococcoidales bacterium]|nr:4Fe-4S dicluster domain-containing protein [Dehalococcoidales bacterium]
MQYGFYFDQKRCTGCLTCVIACNDYHDLSEDSGSLIRMKTIEKGKYPNPFVAYFPLFCYHCANPACVAACPAGAISKRKEDGIVVVDGEACLGKDKCGLCLEACPYEVPQFGSDVNSRMQKCDLCAGRWAEGKKPICVDGCPMLALDAGPTDELMEKHNAVRDAEGFVYSDDANPAIVCKPRKDMENRAVKRITIAPHCQE